MTPVLLMDPFTTGCHAHGFARACENLMKAWPLRAVAMAPCRFISYVAVISTCPSGRILAMMPDGPNRI
jgi:hypothetical protein